MSTNFYISGSIVAETYPGYSSKDYVKKKVRRIIQEAKTSYTNIYTRPEQGIPVDIHMYVTDTILSCTIDDADNFHDKYGEVVVSLSGTIVNSLSIVDRVLFFVNRIISAFIADNMTILSGTLYLASSTRLKPSVVYTVNVTDEVKRLHPMFVEKRSQPMFVKKGE